MRKNLYLFFLIISTHLCYPQIINKIPLSERITGYQIDVQLDPVRKCINGTLKGYWVNKSPETVPDIRMHLYMNAFRSNRSTFYKEAGDSPGINETDPGWIEIFSFTDNQNRDLLPSMKFISPDDGNPEDRTVISVTLPEPAKPGDTVFVNIVFETKLPSRIIRTGFSDDFYFVAQWFPKFGVYEFEGIRYAGKGEWNCHQFHRNSEFYSYHSVYDVTITLPEKFIVGSGGMLISEEKSANNTKKLTYRAEDIVDFAWTAWPGYSVFKDKWNNVDITLLIPGNRINQVERQLTAVRNALEYLDRNVGPYPWQYLTFVDPPAKGGGAGGMEYTTLFTSSSSPVMPPFIHVPEMVTVHEFGHAYFMGILASNEFEEPWLDEGVNSYWEVRMMDYYYGSKSGMIDHPLLKIPDITSTRLGYVSSPSRQATTNAEYSWNYPHGTYGMMSYQKAAIILHTLTGIVGEETMNEIFREYYRKWAFKHPSGKDFIDVANEVVRKIHGDRFGQDLNWFFDQTLYGTGICDYKVADIINQKLRKPEGRIDSHDTLSYEGTDTDSLYSATVQLERIGEVTLPVEVLIHFEDGTEKQEEWDGKSRYRDFTYTGTAKIEWVKIDPQFKIKMDVNYKNNSMKLNPDRTPLKRLVKKFVAFIQFFITLNAV
ncbi:MAG: M1 family metallopeptidase [Bacteroidales bacterium]|nr:M1 family metallopeptidase [Bacteroidales bacterium]